MFKLRVFVLKDCRDFWKGVWRRKENEEEETEEPEAASFYEGPSDFGK